MVDPTLVDSQGRGDLLALGRFRLLWRDLNTLVAPAIRAMHDRYGQVRGPSCSPGRRGLKTAGSAGSQTECGSQCVRGLPAARANLKPSPLILNIKHRAPAQVRDGDPHDPRPRPAADSGALAAAAEALGLPSLPPQLAAALSAQDGLDLRTFGGPSSPYSPYFEPGLPHAILIELKQALNSYQDYHMSLLAGLTMLGAGQLATEARGEYPAMLASLRTQSGQWVKTGRRVPGRATAKHDHTTDVYS